MSESEEMLEKKTKELTKKVIDQEKQILLLQKQQRDVRFLAKRLSEEMQSRISKRAQVAKTSTSLVYLPDHAISDMISGHPKKISEMLNYIHVADKKNIKVVKHSPTGYLKPIGWKVVDKMLHSGIRITKKAAAKRAKR